MKIKRVVSVAAGILFAIGTVGLCAGCDNPVSVVEPPEIEYKVHQISLQYGGSTVNGTLSVDLSQGELALDAVVTKDEGADAAVVFDSSEKEVATVDSVGKVTLKSAGETLITASCGGKEQKFVLVVGDNSPKTAYTVTVNGGIAVDSAGNTITSAVPGTYVTLSAAIDLEHNNFIRWNFGEGGDDLWLNGNVFRMPARNIAIEAESEAILYSLRVVGGTVTAAGEELNPEGEDCGYTDGGQSEEFKITEYKIAYNQPVTVNAAEAPEQKMFVGWDLDYEGNRVGELGMSEHEFPMEDRQTTVYAVYTPLTNGILPGAPGEYNNASRGYKTITDGTPSGESQVAEYEGLSGFRLAIPANTTRNNSDYVTNCGRLNFDNITYGNYHGRYLCKAVFRNHSEKYPVTVEISAEYNGLYFLSGEIEIQPGETVTRYFLAEIGFERPSGGITVKKNIGGSADETVLLDVVTGCAPEFSAVDGRFTPIGIPEYLNLEKWLNGSGLGVNSDTGWTSWRPMFIDNDFGISTIMMPGGNASLGKGKFIGTQINNMPAYDEANPVTTVYVKIINLFASQYNFGGKTLQMSIGTNKDPALNELTQEFRLEPGEETLTLKFEIPRTADDEGVYYVHFYNPSQEGAFGMCVQMTYNNVFGYEE